MYLHRKEVLQEYGSYAKMIPRKYLPVFARVRLQAPHVFAQKFNSPRIFSCLYCFCAGSNCNCMTMIPLHIVYILGVHVGQLAVHLEELQVVFLFRWGILRSKAHAQRFVPPTGGGGVPNTFWKPPLVFWDPCESLVYCEPLLRTLLWTLAQNPSQNLLRTLLRSACYCTGLDWNRPY